MKKLFIVSALLCISFISFSQVFNTATILKPGKFSLGIEPTIVDRDLGLFLHGGVGLTRGVDLGLKYGFLPYNDYFGADLEWRLMAGKPSISLTTGGHERGDFGLDLGLNLSFPVAKTASLYTGFDSDINFPKYSNGTQFLAWIPVGVQLYLKPRMAFMLEAEIPLNNVTYSIFGGGLNFYF
ncbi:MAG TPA: hypothetical protein VIH57_03715 [Bacteroidales bacterium]